MFRRYPTYHLYYAMLMICAGVGFWMSGSFGGALAGYVVGVILIVNYLVRRLREL